MGKKKSIIGQRVEVGRFGDLNKLEGSDIYEIKDRYKKDGKIHYLGARVGDGKAREFSPKSILKFLLVALTVFLIFSAMPEKESTRPSLDEIHFINQ